MYLIVEGFFLKNNLTNQIALYTIYLLLIC